MLVSFFARRLLLHAAALIGREILCLLGRDCGDLLSRCGFTLPTGSLLSPRS
jgi:hypothetical protein